LALFKKGETYDPDEEKYVDMWEKKVVLTYQWVQSETNSVYSIETMDLIPFKKNYILADGDYALIINSDNCSKLCQLASRDLIFTVDNGSVVSNNSGITISLSKNLLQTITIHLNTVCNSRYWRNLIPSTKFIRTVLSDNHLVSSDYSNITTNFNQASNIIQSIFSSLR
jgi:hypothetical protein